MVVWYVSKINIGIPHIALDIWKPRCVMLHNYPCTFLIFLLKSRVVLPLPKMNKTCLRYNHKQNKDTLVARFVLSIFALLKLPLSGDFGICRWAIWTNRPILLIWWILRRSHYLSIYRVVSSAVFVHVTPMALAVYLHHVLPEFISWKISNKQRTSECDWNKYHCLLACCISNLVGLSTLK